MRFKTTCVSGRFSLLVPSRFDQVRHGVEPQAVDPEIEPEPHDAEHGLDHLGIVEVEIGLVRIEAMPVVGLGDRIPGPVGTLGVDEDDARALVFLIGVRPDIEVARYRAWLGAAGALEPWMLVGRMVDHQLGDDAQTALVGGGD